MEQTLMEPCSLQHLIQVSQIVAFVEEKECIEEEDKNFTKPASAKWTSSGTGGCTSREMAEDTLKQP